MNEKKAKGEAGSGKRSALRIKGSLANFEKSTAAATRRKQGDARGLQRSTSGTDTRRRLCTYCGHYRLALEFSAGGVRYRYCETCRGKHPELCDERTDTRRSVRARSGGLPGLGRTRR